MNLQSPSTKKNIIQIESYRSETLQMYLISLTHVDVDYETEKNIATNALSAN